MGLFNKKEGGLVDVIRCDEQDYLVWKWRPSGEANSTRKENAIRYGSSLRVKDGEVAVFVYKKDDGTVMDYIEGPYDGTVKTANLPVLTSIVGLAFGGESPFQAEIYFMNLAGNNKLQFAIPYFDVADPRSLDITVPFAVRGSITFNLTDYSNFIKLNRLIDFDLDAFRLQIKGAVTKFTKSFVANCPVDNNMPVLQLERRIVEISDMIQSRLTSVFQDDFGVNLKRFDLTAIEPDKESAGYREFSKLTKEQQMRRTIADTEAYETRVKLGAKLSTEQQFIQAHAIDQQADVLKTAAQSMEQMGGMDFGDGGGMNPTGLMMGMAMGGAMGGQMANMMNKFGQPQQPVQQQGPSLVPPPVPGAVSFMLAINGQQSGPYNMQQLQQMAQSGQINMQTYVWKQGMSNWEMAGNVEELSGLFPPMAPPIPPTV